jgi:hypothetical protein
MALGTVAVPAAGSIDLKISAIPTNPLLTTDSRLTNLDATISSRLATAGYTAPANSDITAIKAKTDNLPAAPAAVGDVPTAAANAAAVRSNLTTELGRIDAAISTRSTLDAAGVWGYATRTITSGGITLGEIEASTILAKDATVAAIPAGVWAYGVRALTVAAGLTPAQDATLTAINDKTSALPATPAAKSDIPTAAQNATAVLAVAYEGTESIGEYLRYTRAIMLGRNRGTKLFPAWGSKDDSKVRVSAPISSAGIRGAITVLDPS